ncbi:glycoside hydrolase family 9 protein [Pseudonocardia humida]|uniref:glycoside hydrolase family 9 protein n=1 Tax=Pseudonocardia humida TaxID=2800819 RepID=UPI003FD836F1
MAAARTAHAAAHRHPHLLAPDDGGAFGGGPYPDDDPTDDFYWAAAELYLATGEAGFEAEVGASPWHTADAFDPTGFDYDRVAAPARLDLALAPSGLPDRDRVRGTVVAAAERLVRIQAGQPWEQPYDPPEGYDWGSTGRILNNLVVLATAHRLTGERRFRDAVLSGLDYVLGSNGLGQSYVVGHGTDHPRRTHARMFGHALDPALPPAPSGSVAGGANSRRYDGFPADPELAGLPPQLRYLDEPTSETTNDILRAVERAARGRRDPPRSRLVRAGRPTSVTPMTDPARPLDLDPDGLAVRREVLGPAHVDAALGRADDVTAEFQEMITRYAWGGIWTRPGLDRRMRSAVTLTALIAHGHFAELELHLRGALRNGLTRAEIVEVLLQSAIYCGVPAANSAFRVAQRVLAEEPAG